MRISQAGAGAILCALASVFSAAAAVAAPPGDLPDVGLATRTSRSETSRSVAVNPANPDHWLAALDVEGQCRVRSSSDGARTWSPSVVLPSGAAGACFDPVVAYAANGARAYAVYGSSEEDGLLFSASGNSGASWSAPVTIPPPPDSLVGGGSAHLFGQRLATPLQGAQARYIYLAANAYVGESFFGLLFTRSADHGATWAPWVLVTTLSVFYTPFNSGMSIAGGLNGHVLLAWDEASDEPPGSGPRLKIRIAHSGDFGAEWSPPIVAAREALSSRGSPDVKIGRGGAAHLVYARTRPGSDDPALTDIRYVTSGGVPYTAWSTPVTLSSGGAVRVHDPVIAVEPCGSNSVLHVIWNDGRRHAELRDIFYTRKRTTPGAIWSRNIRVSDPTPPAVVPLEPWVPATAAMALVGLHGLAASGNSTFALWTDRRDGDNSDTDVFGSRIRSGVMCP